ncbi:hypothetical protein E0W68_12470 [Flavobacterium salilacus subsp. salilacus]|uniref:hypothetical protein n=1 Tax=Flavobacterium TaxID=237 RepID=UPI001074FF74|nr:MULTISPECIES: hypothetical protein [Flavobacterium]KAF2516338.1 hypothetical protein E0W68_12470 [Flavobacterium salilacus subsp. salilacus]MBE1613871.1 hypothetical protein [Flavobacterium sp. SaA2.13]
MNFTTQMSTNNRLLLVDKFGKTKETLFNDVSYFGDKYVLAKEDRSIFYTVLDLEGNAINESLNVIHRFDDGLLLTYSSFAKNYKSSDGFSYAVNYNVYSIYNHNTRTSSVVSVIQSDPLDKIENQGSLKVEKIKNFMNKTIYTFNDLIFSEIIDEQYMVVASHFDLAAKKSMKNYLNSLFETFQNKRIWNILNIFEIPVYNGETNINALLSGRIFKEIEYTLYTLIEFPDTNVANITFEKEKSQKAEKIKPYIPLVKSMRNSIWKKKSKWQMMFTDLIDFSFN